MKIIAKTYLLENKDKIIIKKWAKDNGYSIKDLATLLGLSYFHLSRCLNGNGHVSCEVVEFMKILGIQLEENY